MDKKYKKLSASVEGMSAAGISGSYETLAGNTPLFRRYNTVEDKKEESKESSEEIPVDRKTSIQKMKP